MVIKHEKPPASHSFPTSACSLRAARFSHPTPQHNVSEHDFLNGIEQPNSPEQSLCELGRSEVGSSKTVFHAKGTRTVLLDIAHFQGLTCCGLQWAAVRPSMGLARPNRRGSSCWPKCDPKGMELCNWPGVHLPEA